MSANPGTQGEGTTAVFTGDQPNPILTFLQQPRILLSMLAGWSVLAALTESFTSSALFMDNKDREIDGAIGGLALGWEGVALAVLYLYCARNPGRFSGIFWLAILHMGAMALSQVYHWLITDDFTFESIVIPLAGSLGLAALAFVNVFQSKQEPGQSTAAATN
jgi:hypothetical protein